MRVRTNLGPTHLEGLIKALTAASKEGKEWAPENQAERELMRQADQVYDLFCDSLALEFKKILLED